MSNSTRLIAIFAIVAAALGLRMGALLAWRDAPLPAEATTVMEQADLLVRAYIPPHTNQVQSPPGMLIRSWFSNHGRPPLFSGLVAAATIAGRSAGIDVHKIEAASWIALAAGMWLLLPAWLLLRRLGDDRIALLGLALIAAMPAAVKLSARPLPDTLCAGLMLYSLNLLIGGLADRNYDRLVAAGLLAGLASLTRSDGASMIPVAAMTACIGPSLLGVTWRFAAAGFGVFTAGMLAAVSPFVYVVSKSAGGSIEAVKTIFTSSTPASLGLTALLAIAIVALARLFARRSGAKMIVMSLLLVCAVAFTAVTVAIIFRESGLLFLLP